ncbi:MAG: hypothetical protein GEU28_08415 [Dehalococcoidia bacterium]|nr:hypothetical protein [Dehalococcoidia bacterium]
MALNKYLEQLIGGDNEALSSKALARLSGLDSGATKELAETWPRIDAERRREIVSRAAQLSEDSVEFDFSDLFKIAIKDSDSNVRQLGIQGLWEYEAPDLIEPLVTMMASDDDPGVRSTAALALGRFIVLGEFEELKPGDLARVENALRETYESADEDIEVRARALESLGARSEDYVQEMIERAHGSGNYRMRLSAIHAMGRNCDPRWLPALIEEMADDEAEVRFEAVGAAGMVADQSAINAVADLLEDDDREVQMAAIDALGHIGGRRVKQQLRPLLNHEDEGLRGAAEAALDEADFDLDPLSAEYRA